MGLRGRSFFENDWLVSFVTTTVMNFENIFSTEEKYYGILMDSLKFLLEKYKVKLISYVFMPNHLHLILYIESGKILSAFMRDFKKYTSFKIREQLIADGREDILSRLRMNAKYCKSTVFKIWKDRFDDFIIYGDKIMEIKMDYIHLNPVRKGLVKNPEDWKYSSYRNYYCNDQRLIRIMYF
ncbi:MAG: transposase [Bacteroidetes bacterium]|nr:transposase [Bacteroidota bacterium]